MSEIKETLRAGYRTIVGGGDPSLLRRKRYHDLREQAERQVLEESRSRPGFFHPVGCPACGRSESRHDFSNPVGFRFSTCSSDGTVYMNPAPTLETLIRLYNDESYSMHWSVGHTADPQDYVRAAASLPPASGQSLLDVGCATGEFLKLAQKRFACHGVEINADTAEIARQNGFDVVTGTLADVPGAERFDVITMLQVIEHLVEPIEPLADVHRLLKPGGAFFLNTPCVDSASFSLFCQKHMHVMSFGHVCLFTKQGLAQLAQRTGFTMSDHGYCGGMDIQLHDLLGYHLAPKRFRHRVAFYSPRFMNLCKLIDRATLGGLAAVIRPRGNESYQWAIFRKPSDGIAPESAHPVLPADK